jgi:peptidoglycan/xylan/chitin deacetylase (PgdA/CDA1 family)
VFIKSLKHYIEFLFAFGCWILLGFARKRIRRVVLYYHGIQFSEAKSFEKQMTYLAANCLVVKPSEILTADSKGSVNVVAITFDDAFDSIKKYAIPVLNRCKITAAVCVPAGCFSTSPGWQILDGSTNDAEKVMTEHEVATLSKEGFEILSHTLSHPILTELADEQMDIELAGSKKRLEQIIGQEVPAVTYPYGAYDARVCEAARRAGYKMAFSTEPRVLNNEPDMFKIGRFKVLPGEGLMALRLRISGAYQAVLFLRRLKSFIK